MSTLKIFALELTVGPASSPGHYPVTARGLSGGARATMVLDSNDPDFRAALTAIEQDATDEDLFLNFGRRLFNALFTGPVEDAYRAALGYAKGQGGKLRLRLRLGQAPEVAALPWEYLYDPQRDLFLAIATDTPLSRYLDVEQLFPGPPPAEPPLRVLLVLSNPADLDDYGLPPLSVDRERRVVEEGLAALRREGQVELQVLTQARRAAISEAMRRFRPHVFHLVGHGAFRRGRGVVLLEREDGRAWMVSDRAFREFFQDRPETRLVVLNACQGATRDGGEALAGLGPRLVQRGVPAVVAMQYAVRDGAAVDFAREFYRVLAGWAPVDVAVTEGRRAVYLDYGVEQRDWGVPVLLMRDPDGLLFLPPEAEQPEAETAAPPTGGVQIHIGEVRDASVSIGDVAGRDIHKTTSPAGAASPPTGRLADLEDLIREVYGLLREYEEVLILTDDPKERLRARRRIEEQRTLLRRYLSEYRQLAQRLGRPVPPEIQEMLSLW